MINKGHACLFLTKALLATEKLNTIRTTRLEKCDISLNQLLKNSKNTAYIFSTFRNHVGIFLSQNIMQNV